MKRQYLKLITLACSAVFGLAACGSSGSSDSAPNFSGADAGSIFGNGTAKNNGSNGNGGNSGNANSNCGFFGCFAPDNNGNGGNNNGNGGNNNGSGGNNNGNGGNNVPQLTGIGFHSDEGYQATHGTNDNPSDAAVSGSRNRVTIDGYTVDLSNADGFRERYLVQRDTRSQDGEFAAISTNGNNLSYMRFGTVTRGREINGETHGDEYAFSIGNITPGQSMPTTGTAWYEGIANLGPASIFKSKFYVDFGQKALAGGVLHPALENTFYVPMVARINGSSFGGTKDGITVKGSFYGPNAEEMGGVFHGSANAPDSTHRDLIGAFGARKQMQ